MLDTCLYYKYKGGQITLLAVYVDDIMIASADLEYIKEIKKQFCKKFDMTDMGELHHFLISGSRGRKSLFGWISLYMPRKLLISLLR